MFLVHKMADFKTFLTWLCKKMFFLKLLIALVQGSMYIKSIKRHNSFGLAAFWMCWLSPICQFLAKS